MDPALLREREAFKKRAMATPTVEKKTKIETVAPPPKDDAKKKMRPPTAPKLDSNTYKTMAGSSQYRFGVLAKIVKHMRTRHQDGDDHPLTLEEILDETNQLDVGQSVKNWLGSEALMNNPKIEVTPDGMRFSFKPVYKIKDGKSLLRLLKQHDLKGLGGILLEDVQESLPHCEKVLKNRASEIIFIVRPIDKKKILFYNDRTANFSIDEEFQKLWRSATVDAMDDAKIDEYLEKQGIRSMQDHGPKKPVPKRKKVSNKKRQFKKPRDNEHLADVLETYEDNTLTQKGWWTLIDGMSVDQKHQITTGQVFIGVFGTISFFMVNVVKNSHISEDNTSESGARVAKIWLLIGFVMGFASIIAAVWVMIDDFINNPKKDSSLGVALLMQNFLILFASLTYKFGRDEEVWNY